MPKLVNGGLIEPPLIKTGAFQAAVLFIDATLVNIYSRWPGRHSLYELSRRLQDVIRPRRVDCGLSGE